MTDTADDIRQERSYQDYLLIAPDPCSCGGEWTCIGYDPAYGADADGRRGTWLREWECNGCGALTTTQGS